MIDHAIRSRGIGGSEIAAILGLDPRRDAFSVYAEKVGLVPHNYEPNDRMEAGKFLEQGIAAWYAKRTGQEIEWCDTTRCHPDREWQVWSPDALVLGNENGIAGIRRHIGGVDAKNVSYDQSARWGEPGTDSVPDYIHLQCQWYASGEDLPWWDVAACFGGNDLRIYRVNRDAQIEAAILEEAERFWRGNVLARVPPPPGPSPATVDALRQMFPRNVQALRCATAEEAQLLTDLKTANEEWEVVNRRCTEIENRLKLSIGEAEGLIAGKYKLTWRREKDSTGPDWEKLARELALRLALLQHKIGAENYPLEWCETIDQMAGSKEYQRTTRHGARKLLPNWGRK